MKPSEVPDDLYDLALDALPGEPDEIISATTQEEVRAALAAVIPEIEKRAVEAERAAIARNIRHYFAASDTDGPDGLWDDVQVLCGRIERGEYGDRTPTGDRDQHSPAGRVWPVQGIWYWRSRPGTRCLHRSHRLRLPCLRGSTYDHQCGKHNDTCFNGCREAR